MASVRVLSKELEQKVACELWCRRSQVESDLCHHQNHLPDRLRDDGCGADNRAWMMSSRQSPTTMYRSWVWCTECSSLDVCGTLWTNLLPRTKNKATIEVFAGQPNEESVWETTTYCPSTRLVSRSIFTKTPISDDRRFCLCAFFTVRCAWARTCYLREESRKWKWIVSVKRISKLACFRTYTIFSDNEVV